MDMHAAYAEIARRFEASARHARVVLHRTLVAQPRHRHWRIASRGALARGLAARRAAISSTRMRASGKRLLLLTNSHPIALAVKHEETGVLDYLDASVTSHEFGHPKEHARILAGGSRAAAALIRRAACSSMTIPGCSRPRREAGIRWVYGVRHWDTKGSQREHMDHPASTASPSCSRLTAVSRASRGVSVRRAMDRRHDAATGGRRGDHRHRRHRHHGAVRRAPPPPPGRRTGRGPSSGSHSLYTGGLRSRASNSGVPRPPRSCARCSPRCRAATPRIPRSRS